MSKKRYSNEQIAEVITQAQQLGLSYKEAAARFEVPLWKIYRYNCTLGKRDQSDFEQTNNSEDSLQQPSVKQFHEPEKDSLPDQVKEIIIQYREKNPDHGFKRIEQHLRNSHFLVIPRKKIRHVLKKAGLLDQLDSSFDSNDTTSEPIGSRRFEAGRPCELYQMDITYVYIQGLKVLYLIDLIDDYSRFCLSAALNFDQSSDTLIEVLHNSILTFGKPEKLLTDQGKGFYSWSSEQTKFQQYLDDMRIEHIVADPHHPTTTGKVERFHQTIKNEVIRKVKFKSYTDAVEKIEAFVHYYNFERPHQSLDGACPADRFMGISVSKALARHEVLSRDLQHTKGYLVYKLGPHEVSIVHGQDQVPKVYVNGICYIAKNAHVL